MRQLSQGSIGIVDVDTSAYATAQPTRWSNVWALWAQKVSSGKKGWGMGEGHITPITISIFVLRILSIFYLTDKVPMQGLLVACRIDK